ncbi:AAA family ATPase [Conexibacter sp. W3-3-2]|nr:AAA family ATPase [Conexibacter sp. W3-3-2]
MRKVIRGGVVPSVTLPGRTRRDCATGRGSRAERTTWPYSAPPDPPCVGGTCAPPADASAELASAPATVATSAQVGRRDWRGPATTGPSARPRATAPRCAALWRFRAERVEVSAGKRQVRRLDRAPDAPYSGADVSPGGPTGRPMLQREAELARLHALCAAAADGHGALAFVEGHAGIGKTRLLDATVAAATDRGLGVLRARGGLHEQGDAYGIVRQLLGFVLDERLALLHGPAALATGVLEGRAQPGADSPFPVLHALHRVLVTLLADGPLLLVVDDAHWADEPSLRLLDVLAARVDRHPLALLVAARPRRPGRDDTARLLAALRARAPDALVEPAPLGPAAVRELLARDGAPAPRDDVVRACVQVTAGNPYLVGEVVTSLERAGRTPATATEAEIRGLGPASIAASLRLRLSVLPPSIEAVAEAVSILAPAAEIRHVAALVDRPGDEVAVAVDVLAGLGILAPRRPVRFTHPIVAQAVSDELPPAQRARLHRRAADALLAEGQPPTRAASHLLRCEAAGDPEVVAVLRAAAVTALAQGAATPARRYLDRALAEPPALPDRPGLLGLLGQALAAEGVDLDEACRRFEEAAELEPTRETAAVHLEHAARLRLFSGDPARALRLLDRPFARGTVDRETTLRLRAHQASIGVLAPLHGRPELERLEQWAALPGDTPGELAVLAELAAARWLQGRIRDAAALAQRALADGRLLAAEGPLSTGFNHALHVLLDADRHDLAEPVLGEALALARAQGATLAASSLLGLRAVALWRRGDVPGTHRAAQEALALLHEVSPGMAGPAQAGYVALAAVELGDLPGAQAALDGAGLVPQLHDLTFLGAPFDARARLQLARGRSREARDTLEELADRDRRLGLGHLSTPWRRTAVEAALAHDAREEARTIADEQLRRSERWDVPSARGLALATSGLVTAGPRGIEQLRAGIALLEGSPARLDLARAQLDLGRLLRRERRETDARDPLRAALDLADRCGAATLADRAREELLATGARPRGARTSGDAALTAGERRIARLAAAGRTNREIAAELVLSVRTVENHLGRVYGKLGIGSRHELAGALEPER